jgi:cyclophilin family peptidyl-prolyl cis-trans isomerase
MNRIVALLALSLVAARAAPHAPLPSPTRPIPAKPAELPSPGEIVAAANPSEWTAIAASDLLLMELAADAKGKPRRVVIQLMPPPFSQGWIGNIRKLAAAHWWDGTSVNRVQDNYVVQWGDVTEKKPLPAGLVTVGEEEYVLRSMNAFLIKPLFWDIKPLPDGSYPHSVAPSVGDPFASNYGYVAGIPVALDIVRLSGLPDPNPPVAWPVHCYAMVGVGRNLSPDTGTGAELYTVIGHAPRHLDRNIALVGRVIEGIEHLSSLPRGTGALGFYETAEERVPILSIRLGTEVKDLPRFEYLSTESASFARYADARANRRDPFFIRPAGGADICNIPVPVRRVK